MAFGMPQKQHLPAECYRNAYRWKRAGAIWPRLNSTVSSPCIRIRNTRSRTGSRKCAALGSTFRSHRRDRRQGGECSGQWAKTDKGAGTDLKHTRARQEQKKYEDLMQSISKADR